MRAVLVICFGVAAMGLRAQPLFEVATVKPNRTGANPRTYPRLHNGTFQAENASLKMLLTVAFGLIELRVSGPEWLNTERYDITAKAAEGVADSEVQPLLQALLKDRFHLESHFETKEMPVFDMTVAKSGLKLKAFDPAHPPESPKNYGQSVMMGVGSSNQIADALARAVGRPVVDKTELEGRFGWIVNFTPFSANAAANDSAAPDIFAAIEQQLGLRLESKRESLRIVVVDHVERVPTEN